MSYVEKLKALDATVEKLEMSIAHLQWQFTGKLPEKYCLPQSEDALKDAERIMYV